MLIEVRSSPDDTNNTPNQLFQRFNETLILKPRSKIALVSALITTSGAGGFRIDGTNQTMTLRVGSQTRVTVDIPIGDYNIKGLCLAIQTALRANIPLVIADGVRQVLYKDLFYPDAAVVVAKSATDIVTIKFAFEPQGFTSLPPLAAASTDTEVSSTNLDLNFNNSKNGLIMRSRKQINNANVVVISKEVSSGFDAIHSILPYAKGTSGDHFGLFEIDKLVTCPARQQHFGLNQSSGLSTGRWLLPSANPYTILGSPLVYRFDNYTPVAGVNHRYDWIVGTTGIVYYLKATGDLTFGVNFTHKVIDPLAYDQTWSVREEADSNLGAAIFDGVDLLEPPAGTPINRAGENNYDLEVNTNSRVQVRYNGTILNTPSDTLLADGDGLRWVVNALDEDVSKTKHPVPQIYHAQDAAPKWEDIPLAAGKILPDVTIEDVLIPSYHTDGLVACGTIGNGEVTDLNSTASFQGIHMAVTEQVGTFHAGEILYQVGDTAGTVGGRHMKLMAVTGTTLIGGAKGALTSNGLRVLGNGYQGTGYVVGMSFSVKGLVSGSTATITLHSAAAAPIATITDGGSTYTQGTEYPFILNVAGSPLNPPIPFAQTGRFTRSGIVKATAVGAGAITEVQFVDGGNGFMVGDTIEIQSNGAGDGDGLARVTIQQVCEDVNQFQINPTGSFDTKNLGGAFPPFTPQDQIELNTQEVGLVLDLVPLEFDGSVGAGVSQPIITSSQVPVPNNPENENILIDLPGIPIGSRNSGRQGNQTGGNTDNHIATIPYQTDLTDPKEFHKQHYEPFNMIYHSMDNEADLNMNSFSVRLTNFDGTLRTDIAHPTQLTFSIQPDYM